MRIDRTVFALAVCASAAVCHFVPARAAAPMVKTQAPGFYRMMLGDFEITALNDGTIALPVDKLLTNVTPEEVNKGLAHVYLSVPVETSFNGFLVNTGAKLVLIDTGAGNTMGPTNGRLVADLHAAGYEPSQVDEIYITHFHGDHIGGLTLDGQRVFPNAIVRADKGEADYWLSPQKMAAASAEAKGSFQSAMKALDPYVKAGKFKPITTDGVLVQGVSALATPGHTPGHTSYVVESQGKKLVVIGDLIHVGAVQFPHPSVTINFDTDSKAALAARERMFKAASDEGFWIAAAHLSFPAIGHVRAEQGGFVWIPANYSIPH